MERRPNDFWRQKTRVPRGVVCVILRLAVLTQCWRVTDTITANTRASIASHEYKRDAQLPEGPRDAPC